MLPAMAYFTAEYRGRRRYFVLEDHGLCPDNNEYLTIIRTVYSSPRAVVELHHATAAPMGLSFNEARKYRYDSDNAAMAALGVTKINEFDPRLRRFDAH